MLLWGLLIEHSPTVFVYNGGQCKHYKWMNDQITAPLHVRTSLNVSILRISKTHIFFTATRWLELGTCEIEKCMLKDFIYRISWDVWINLKDFTGCEADAERRIVWKREGNRFITLKPVNVYVNWYGEADLKWESEVICDISRS